MHDAELDCRLRVRRADRIREALETVYASNQNILHPAIAQLGQDLQPQLGPLGCAGPKPQHLFGSFLRYADAHEHRPVLDPALVSHLYKQRVQVRDQVNGIERSILPCTHLIEHRIGHLADQCRADLDSIHLFQVALNVARAHAPRVHRQNLLIEAREASFVLGDDLRLERPVPVTGHFDVYRPEVSLYLLAASAVAVVAAAAPFRRVLFIAEVVIQLGIHRPLD